MFQRTDSFPQWSQFCCTYASTVTQSHDNGYVLAGKIAYGISAEFFWEKIDSLGNHIWNQFMGIQGSSRIQSLEATSDNGFILCGIAGPSYHPVCLIKIDSMGIGSWQKFIGYLGSDTYGYSVIQTFDGGYIIGGARYLPGYYDAEIIKTNNGGNVEWSKSYGGNNEEKIYSIIQTSDSGYIASGYTESFGGHDIYIIKTNEVGDTLWTKTYSDTLNAYEGVSIQQTFDNGYIVAGYPKTYWGGYSGSFIMKLNTLGNIQWTKILGQSDSLAINSVRQTSDSGFILCASLGYLNSHACLIKTDSIGNSLWVRTFNNSETFYEVSARQTKDGGYIVAAGFNAFVIKTDSNGNTNCTQGTYPLSVGSSSLFSKSVPTIVVPDSEAVVIVQFGYSDGDTLGLFPCNSVNIPEITNPQSELLLSPNPATSHFTISGNFIADEATVTITDVTGRQVLCKKIAADKNSINVELSFSEEGIYFVSVIDEKGNRQTEKLLMMKN